MIDLRQLNDSHIGTKVVYIQRIGNTLFNREWGHISSWNDRYIFVKFPNRVNSQAVSPQDLVFYELYDLFIYPTEPDKALTADSWNLVWDDYLGWVEIHG